EQLPASDRTVPALRARLPRTMALRGDGLPRVDVAPGDPAPSSRKGRQAETKARKQLAQAGHAVEQRWLTSPQDVAAALPDLERVHRLRDLDARGSSAHDDPDVLAFYRAVVQAHAEAGEVDLLTLRVDGDLAAYVLAFRDGDVLRVWDNRVAPAWRHVSAGRLANAQALQRVAEDPAYRTLDWMRGEEAYKLSSATRVDRTQHLLAWSSGAARLPYDARKLAKRARDLVRPGS
ncbi:MAG: hypothetical protein JWN17_2880, partial [Frankiales bacterium]|nr:hypothetical protein [Frankiales bacterium]